MPEIIPDHVPSPRTLLAWDGTVYRPVSIDAAGRLQVRGENQLFSFKGVLALRKIAAISGAGGYLGSDPVPAGEIWVVTTICTMDATTAVTEIEIINVHDAVDVTLQEEAKAFAIAERSQWGGHTYLDVGDVIRCAFTGSLAGDSIYLWITGYRMTVET